MTRNRFHVYNKFINTRSARRVVQTAFPHFTFVSVHSCRAQQKTFFNLFVCLSSLPINVSALATTRASIHTLTHPSLVYNQVFLPLQPNPTLHFNESRMGTVNKTRVLPSLAPAMERDMPEDCPECGGVDIVENWRQGTAECRSCGLVIMERLLDLGTEWRTFTSEEGDDPNRAGKAANPLLDSEQGTSIGTGGRGGGALGVALNRAQQRNATSAADKVMINVMSKIDFYCDRLRVTGGVSKRSKELFKGYQDHLTLKKSATDSSKFVRSRNLRDEEINEVVAGSLFIACRNEKVPRTYKEICALTSLPKKSVGSVVKKMELVLDGAKTAYVRGTDDFVTRFCNALNLPRDISNTADVVANVMQTHDTVYGKTYTTVAAASIYLVTQLSETSYQRSPKDIAEVTGVADVTIRSTYKMIYPHIASLLPKDFKPTIPLSELPSP